MRNLRLAKQRFIGALSLCDGFNTLQRRYNQSTGPHSVLITAHQQLNPDLYAIEFFAHNQSDEVLTVQIIRVNKDEAHNSFGPMLRFNASGFKSGRYTFAHYEAEVVAVIFAHSVLMSTGHKKRAVTEKMNFEHITDYAATEIQNEEAA